MDRAVGRTDGSTLRVLILSLLLVLSFVNRTDQHDAVTTPETSGCEVSPFPHNPLDDAPTVANSKILKCNNVSVTSVNRDYFKSDDVIYKEIVCQFMSSDDYLNVINEHQTEILKLIDSSATDGQLQKIFHNKSFIRLRELDVSGNRIHQLERETFRKSVRLRKLNLARNDIALLHGDIFEDLLDLNELHLNNNQLKDFKTGVNVFGNLKQLTVLNLSNNSINNIERRLFFGLQNLIKIDLSHNKLYILQYQVISGHHFAIEFSFTLFLSIFFIRSSRACNRSKSLICRTIFLSHSSTTSSSTTGN